MKAFVFIISLLLVVTSCTPVKKNEEAATTTRYLYVATGACYSGNGLTSFTNTTSSNLVYRVNLETGVKEDVIADYYASPSNAGDTPVSIVDYDADHILVLVENTTTVSLRRIELVEKKPYGSRITYTNNTTALSAQLRRMIKLSDNYLLISRSTAAEKHKDGSNRLTIGANAWLTMAAPVSSCTTSNTLITSLAQLNNGMLVYAHAATGQSRIGVVSPLGYTIAGDCKAAQAAPNATSFPTAMFYDSVNQKLIVSYGGSTNAADLNTLYAYTINETTGAISSPQELYDSNVFGSTYNYFLFGIPAMAYDSEKSTVYVASTINTLTTATNYKIEKLTYAPDQIGTTNTAVLTTSASTFYPYGNDTKCISDMMVAQ